MTEYYRTEYYRAEYFRTEYYRNEYYRNEYYRTESPIIEVRYYESHTLFSIYYVSRSHDCLKICHY
jgi:hypothetical protein